MRVAAYLRRSKERDNGYGLEAQEDKIRRWVDYREAELVDVYSDDDVSGIVEPSERSGFARALEAIREGRVDTLVIAKFDRLSRSMPGFVNVLRSSQDDGWRLVCLDPEVDFSTAIGRAMAYMLIAFAEVEREAFIDRMQGGRRAKARAGGYVGGARLHRRYGYELAANEAGRLVYIENAAEQDVIRAIMSMRSHSTYRAIAAALNEQGTPPPAGRQWHAKTVQRICAREES